jgi:hypothetical protein
MNDSMKISARRSSIPAGIISGLESRQAETKGVPGQRSRNIDPLRRAHYGVQLTKCR